MKIKSARLENFMLFDDFDMTWSPNINVICGSNSTGKTVLIKFMYALLKAWRDTDTEKENKERVNAAFVDKLTEQHAQESALQYHVACKANGEGCMDETRLQGVRVSEKNKDGEQ